MPYCRHFSRALGLGLLATAAWGQGTMVCQRVDTQIPVRSEGLAELTSDILLKCSGGTPTRPGASIPKVQFVVASTVPITSRILVPGEKGSGFIESLLLLDEPGFNEQVACETQANGEGCTALAGSALNPNVFQGRQVQPNSVAFRGVPVDPPGPGKTRTIRITNLRVNVAALGSQSPAWGPIQFALQMFDPNGTAISIRDAEKVVAEPRTGLTFSVRTAADTPAPLQGGPVITIPPASVPVGAPQATATFNVKFTEGFPGAFRRRNVATNPDSPLFMTVQPVPGLRYMTESGLFNSMFPTVANMNTAGLADAGTRLRVKFQNIPKDVLLWVSARDVRAGTTEYSENSARAILTTAEPNGGGPLSPVRASINGLAQIPVTNGIATAVWEVVNANPATIQEISFSVAISAQTGSPAQGTVSATGGFAPLETADTAATPMVPLFKDVAKPITAFSVSNLITVPVLNCVSAASYLGPDAAQGSIVSGFGSGLSPSSAVAGSGTLPTLLSGVAVDLIDGTGIRRSAPLFFVSPSQVNFLVDPDTVTGPVLVNVNGNGRLIASGYLQVDAVVPSLFTADGSGSGVLAGDAMLTSGARSQNFPVASYDTAKSRWLPSSVDVGLDQELAFLTLYGTGIRGRKSLTEVRATVNGVSVPVVYAGPQGYFTGVDQVNIGPLPKSLRGSGLANVIVSVRDRNSNPVQVQIQ